MKKCRFIVYLVIAQLSLFINSAFANNTPTKDTMDLFLPVFLIIISAFIGYAVGTLKFFREEKQKVYSESLPAIIKMIYNPSENIDEKEFNRALAKLWLYGSKKVVRKLDRVVFILHDHSRGDIVEALQEAVVEIRKDIQLWPWQKKFQPNEVRHLYTQIANDNKNNKEG